MKILIDEYQLQYQIYGGLSGRLWMARELSGQRQVMIRLLPKLIRSDTDSIERIRSQFNKLQPIIQELNISNLILPDRFCEVADSDSFLVSRFVNGDSIGVYADKWRKVEGYFPLYLLSKIFEPVAWMLNVLQQKNFIHRFITPDSIIINQTDGVMLLDFELTGIIREQVIKIEPRLLVNEISKIRYMAPETLRGQPATQLSDQYSLAVIIYEIIAGHLLFDANSINILLKQITDYIPPDIMNCSVETSRILRKALSNDPLSRFGTTEQFINELIQSCTSDTTNQYVYQTQGVQNVPDKLVIDSQQKNIADSQTIRLPKVLSEFESAASFQEIKTVINSRRKNKHNKSKITKRILRERQLQKIFFFFYLLIFISCIIVTIIFRDLIITMIKDLL
ncbi:MAG: protein kinase [Planctomycetaceae bacterium]|jgi:serine/threonine-protein kinase|nr:protein kinase [Planctomycetaceae bacterium]